MCSRPRGGCQPVRTLFVIVTTTLAVALLPGTGWPAFADPTTAPSTSTPSPTDPVVPSASAPGAVTPSPQAPIPGAGAVLIRTNLQAVVDPVAVPVPDGVRVRVGVRNAGPQSTGPVGFALVVIPSVYINRVRAVGGDCDYIPETPAVPGEPWFPQSYFTCRTGRALLVGQTFWQSFIFPDINSFGSNVFIEIGTDNDPVPSDNTRTVVIRLGSGGGGGLPVTGTSLTAILGGGLALVCAGTLVVALTQRRRVRFTAGP